MTRPRIGLASATQWGELFTLQRAAFVDEAALYGTPDVPPLTETPTEFRARLGASTTLVATQSDRIVGAVCAIVRGPHVEIERLMVAPDRRGQGIGAALMDEIERRLATDGHAQARLIVGERAAGNVALYTRLGYRPVERTTIFGHVEILVMEKQLG